MRKRKSSVVIAIILLVVSVNSTFAGTLKLESSNSTGISVNALMGVFHDVMITPVDNDGLSGLPFDIMGDDVWYRSGTLNGMGRLIATWTIIMNGDARSLSITAQPLRRTKDANGKAVVDNPPQEICYWISFALRYHAHDDANNDIIQEAYIGVYGDGIQHPFNTQFNNFAPLGINTPFVSEDQPVRILLVKSTGVPYSAAERGSSTSGWLNGVYEATVTIEITGGV